LEGYVSNLRICACFLLLFFTEIPLHGQQSDTSTSADNNSTDTSTNPDKRVLGVLPNYRTVDASVPFMPISAKQKLNIARRDSFDWPTYLLAGVLTLAIPGDEDIYGDGVSGFLNRYVRSAADQICGNMMTEALVPILLHQDPRYFRVGTGKASSRLGTALSQILITRNDSGHRVFNASEFLGNATAVGLSNAYSPNLNSWSSRADKLALMISLDTFSNVLKEFGPDITQKVLHRHHSS